MAGISMSDITFPLSYTEATNHITASQRLCTPKAPATVLNWWLRSSGNIATSARSVNGSTSNFNDATVTVERAVRPALWITQNLLIALTE